ncbi:MAG: hypothetical protein KDK24_11245 [Pseudooceanicola sp.]|nr:hypothetical protein [Pseudooceanicola sp.]
MDMKRHAGLVDDMARALGVDLEEAALRGLVDIDEISDAVLRCAGCADPGHCAGVLAAQPRLAAAPGYCRNRALMGQLAAAQGGVASA